MYQALLDESTAIEIEVEGRWDALALSELLIPFHSFLVQLDRERWIVHAHAPGGRGEALTTALEMIDDWRAEQGPRELSHNDPDNGGESVVVHLGETVGYRVDAPEGYLGRVQGVPHAARPSLPLALVVSDRKTVRFVSLSRVAAILPLERRVVLGPARRPMTFAAPTGDAEKKS